MDNRLKEIYVLLQKAENANNMIGMQDQLKLAKEKLKDLILE
jgi:hypothetical protein